MQWRDRVLADLDWAGLKRANFPAATAQSASLPPAYWDTSDLGPTSSRCFSNTVTYGQHADAPQVDFALTVSIAAWTPQLVGLGGDQFFDPRLSADGTVSCARCHQPALYGSDALPRSRGVHDRLNPRNAPTVLNAGLETGAHWRGERKDLEDQATQSFIGPASFGNPDYGAVLGRIKAIAGYAPLFHAAFPGVADPITPAALGRAIGAFERTLVTPAPFKSKVLEL